MVISMTGFGKGISLSKEKRVECDIKSVNHRYLDVSIRIPREYIFLEGKIKERISSYLSRGKIDCFFSIEAFETSKVKIHIDDELVREYKKAFGKLRKHTGGKSEVSLDYLVSLPGVIQVTQTKKDFSEISQLVLEATEKAVKKLLSMRKTEGKALKSDIKSRCVIIGKLVKGLKKAAPQVHKAFGKKVTARIREIENDIDFSKERVEKEIAFNMMKMDISEELTRLDSHMTQIKNVLEKGKVIGRKLDFLIQEANREITTCGNKIQSLDISSSVVEIKSELEKIREQVQNVE